MTMYRLYERIQHFRSIGVPKLSPGYGPGAIAVNFIIVTIIFIIIIYQFFFLFIPINNRGLKNQLHVE